MPAHDDEAVDGRVPKSERRPALVRLGSLHGPLFSIMLNLLGCAWG